MAKIKRYNFAHYIDTSTTQTPTWSRINKGVSELTIDYSAEITTEQYIGDKNASTSVDSYAPTAGLSIVAYENDACFNFIDGIRKTRATGDDACTDILNVNVYDEHTTSGSTPTTYYSAEKQPCIVEITSAGGEGNYTVEATIHYDGDPTYGWATITSGTPTFTETEPS